MAEKGQSPFYPGQPVPFDLFVGREQEIARIRRAGDQVAGGKPQAVFIGGDYGIGKTSLARFIKVIADDSPGLMGFHLLLGTADSVENIAEIAIQTFARDTELFDSGVRDRLISTFSKYIQEVTLLGVKFNMHRLKRDTPDISRGFLPFLRTIYEQSKPEYKGILLTLDEINGLASKPKFGAFLKNLVDENALSENPVPLLLIVCGTKERYREMVDCHKPVERIFDISLIEPMSVGEMKEFFDRAFTKVGIKIEAEAMSTIIRFSGGLPKLMHLVGDSAFWLAENNTVDVDVAGAAVVDAAENVGRKFVDQQVIKALRSDDYQKILQKLGQLPGWEFSRKQLAQGLTEREKKKLDNFLRRMRDLKVITQDSPKRGHYSYRDLLTSLYIKMTAVV